MSKKFLTVFALVALLVAAMAGAAFAANADPGHIMAIGTDGASAIGAIKTTGTPGTDDLTASADFYYISTVKSLDIAFVVSIDATTTATDGNVSGDISADKSVSITHDNTTAAFAAKVGNDQGANFIFTLGSFTTVPGVISIDGVTATAVTGGAKVGNITFHGVEVKPDVSLGTSTTALTEGVATSQDYTVISGDASKGITYNFTNAMLRPMSGDAFTGGAVASTDQFGASVDKGYFTLNFNPASFDIKLVTSSDGPGLIGTYKFGLVADKFEVASDDVATVAGVVGSADVLGTLTITVAAVTPDPSGDVLPVAGIELSSADQALLGVTSLTSADIATLTTNDIGTRQNPVILLSTVSADKTVSSAFVSIDLTPFAGKDAIALQFDAKSASDNTGLIGQIVSTTNSADRLAKLNASMDVYYEYVATTGVSADLVAVIGPKTGAISWEKAISDDIVSFNSTGMLINYVVVNKNFVDGKKFEAKGKYLVIYDGNGADNKLFDPLWVTRRQQPGTPDPHDSSSGVGCDAGFGAFALLGLAGLATILRKKD